MSNQAQNIAEKATNCYCPVPEAIMRASRYELTDLKMEIDGNLPEDLHGHVFIVAPVGSVDSGGLPYPNGDSLLNGDGMIYRLDFDKKGEVGVKTRLVKSPDYYADKATQSGTKYEKYGFRNHGIARFSTSLGLRNQLNTAFLVMKFPQDAHERLLVTYDAGRPYEIDTETLEVVTPVGANKEWRGELDQLRLIIDAVKFPFKSILSTAHPAFDFSTGEMFTVNYGRSFSNFIESIRWIYDMQQLPEEVEDLLAAIFRFFHTGLIQQVSNLFLEFSQDLIELVISWIEKILGKQLDNFTYLIRWNGAGELERWKLINPDGTLVKIEQTIHQIGVTKDYVVLMDTAFITGLEQVLGNPFPGNKKLEVRLRNVLERQALPDSKVYIVRRADLKAGQKPACSQQEVKVMVQQVVIPLEAAHFLVDYDNPDGNLTMHVAHLCAMQVAEWLRPYDVSPYAPHEPVPSHLHGLENNALDIGRMGRYVIHGETGELIESHVISDVDSMWAVDLYSYLDRLPTGLPPGKFENIYWSSFGLWKQLMTEFIFELYKDYKYRLVPVQEVLQLAETGKPACLFRLHTESMTIADRYEFPCGYMTLSPQFVPRENCTSSTDGYILCTVCFKDKNEIWIFDANHLDKGPICKLHHPSLQFGFTLHTAWLRHITSREAEYNIPVKQDYQKLVNQNTLEIQKLFEDEVYPHFA